MKLSLYSNKGFDRGRSLVVEIFWIVCQSIFISSAIPGSWHRVVILKMFGAKIGAGVVMKPLVKIKFPWKLAIGDSSWIGEGVWIDNLSPIEIGSNCCISQGAYLCTGSHDWSSPEFDIILKSIVIRDQVWACAKTVIGPGSTLGEGSVLTMGSVAAGNLDEWSVYKGNPAVKINDRKVH